MESRSGESRKYCELTVFCWFTCSAGLRVWLIAHSYQKVAPGVSKVEQRNTLDIALLRTALLPITIEDMSNLAVGVSLLQSCKTSLLAHHTHNLVTFIIQDNHSYGEVEVLHIQYLLHKLLVQLIAEAELLYVCVLGLLKSLLVEESHAPTIAGEHIEELVLRQHKAIAYLPDNLKRQQVVGTERHILVFTAAD